MISQENNASLGAAAIQTMVEDATGLSVDVLGVGAEPGGTLKSWLKGNGSTPQIPREMRSVLFVKDPERWPPERILSCSKGAEGPPTPQVVSADLARVLGVDLELLHVREGSADDGQNRDQPHVRDFLEERLDELEELLQGKVDELKLAGLKATRTTLTGDPRDTIISHAEKCAHDLIVVGMSERSWHRRRLFGGTAAELLRRARQSVLIVRPGYGPVELST